MAGPAGFLLSFGLVFAGAGQTNPETQKLYFDAARQAGEASYIDSGLKPMIDNGLRDFERRYVPEPVREFGSWTIIIVRTITERKATFVYEF